MGRLIDADAFAVTLKQISEKQGYAELYMNVDDVLNSVIDDLQGNALNGYENCPTVEAIPKEEVRQFIENIQKIKDNHNEHGEPINYGTICGILIEGYRLLDKYMEDNGNDC